MDKIFQSYLMEIMGKVNMFEIPHDFVLVSLVIIITNSNIRPSEVVTQ